MGHEQGPERARSRPAGRRIRRGLVVELADRLAEAAGREQAGLDVRPGEGLLAGSRIEAGLLPSGGFGEAVCQLDDEPATYPPTCWTGTSPFWALFVARGSPAGPIRASAISSIVLHDGDWLGFRYQSRVVDAPPTSAGDCPDPTPPPTPNRRDTKADCRVERLGLPRPTPAPLRTATGNAGRGRDPGIVDGHASATASASRHSGSASASGAAAPTATAAADVESAGYRPGAGPRLAPDAAAAAATQRPTAGRAPIQANYWWSAAGLAFAAARRLVQIRRTR